jgi:hypothetical protein
MTNVGHCALLICSERDGGETYNLRLADAGRRNKSEKKARISGGRGSGKKGTWKIDYSTVGHDIHWDRLSLSDLNLYPLNYFPTAIVVKQRRIISQFSKRLDLD